MGADKEFVEKHVGMSWERFTELVVRAQQSEPLSTHDEIKALTPEGFRLLVAAADPKMAKSDSDLAKLLVCSRKKIYRARRTLQGKEIVDIPLSLLTGLPVNPNYMADDRYQKLVDCARTQPDQLKPLTARLCIETLQQAHPEDFFLYQVADGHHRCSAAQEAGLRKVRVTLEMLDGELEAFDRNIDLNSTRGAISPLQLAETFDYLHQEYGLTNEQIAARYGSSLDIEDPSRVSRVRSLNRLALRRRTLQDALDDRDSPITRSHLEEIATLPESLHEAVFKAIVNNPVFKIRPSRQLIKRVKEGMPLEKAIDYVLHPATDRAKSEGGEAQEPNETPDEQELVPPDITEGEPGADELKPEPSPREPDTGDAPQPQEATQENDTPEIDYLLQKAAQRLNFSFTWQDRDQHHAVVVFKFPIDLTRSATSPYHAGHLEEACNELERRLRILKEVAKQQNQRKRGDQE